MKRRTVSTATAAKLLLAILVAGGALALHVSGLLAREPNPPPAAPRRVPAPKPVVPTAAPAPVDAAFVVRRILDVPQPFRHGDYVWNEAGAPAGPIVITVDLAAQVLSVFRAGYEIGSAVILYGANDKPTPLGVFPILEKDADHVSNLYDAPMPYMLRLTADGVAIHGSPTIAFDRATHGCIGLPNRFAALLFAKAKVGDTVIVTDGKTLGIGQAITG